MKMNMLKKLSTVSAASIAICGVLHAQVYWDINGTNAGATDSTDASGTWDIATTSNWNTASDGTAAVTTFTDTDSVVFSAGNNVAIATITATGTPTATNLTIEEGTYTFDGNLKLGAAATYTVSSGASATFNDAVSLTDNSDFVIEGTSSMKLSGAGKTFTKTGSGTLTLTDSANSDYAINVNEGLVVINRTATKQLKSIVVGASGTLQLSTSDQLNPLTVNGLFIVDEGVSDSLGQLYGAGSIQAGDNTSLNIDKGNFSGDISGDLDISISKANGFSFNDGSSVEFVIGANGVSNSITSGDANMSELNLNGELTFDLTGADMTEGNSWLIVDVDGLTVAYGATFSVTDFTESDGIWTYDSNSLLQFSEATGYLTVVPESSTYALLAGCLGLTFVMLRRRK